MWRFLRPENCSTVSASDDQRSTRPTTFAATKSPTSDGQSRRCRAMREAGSLTSLLPRLIGGRQRVHELFGLGVRPSGKRQQVGNHKSERGNCRLAFIGRREYVAILRHGEDDVRGSRLGRDQSKRPGDHCRVRRVQGQQAKRDNRGNRLGQVARYEGVELPKSEGPQPQKMGSAWLSR